jgi:hypothetical protein
MTKRNRQFRRRGFLKVGLTGLATGAIAPTLWLPRRSLADTPAHGQVKHLILINTDGGMRSTCLFNADVSDQWNPPSISGKQSGANGTDWGVGGVFSAEAHDGGIVGSIPSVPQISNKICVLGTVDHTPGEERGDGTHATARLRIATGEPDGSVGLLTRIYKSHALYQDGGIEENFPPVTINSARLFGVGSGEWGSFRPVAINNYRDFRSSGSSEVAERPSWALDLERGTDDWYAATRAQRHRQLVNGLIDTKRQALTFRPIFTDPILDVENSPDESMHGMSNEELVAALGSDGLGLDLALALRFIGFGSPALAVGDSGWDFHSDELAEFPEQGRNLGRAISGLYFALQALKHPDGGSYFDHTLVAVVSEFGRDNVEANGFNSGNGSDHNGGPGSRYQAIPFFGGVVGKRGKFFGETNASTMEPKSGEPVFGTRSMLATFLDVLGIDASEHFVDEPLTEIF